MAFLDNSGDIILDAVLTDEGRKRLAKGSFTITKFAFGDDEINYGLYDPNHASGSAYYDLEILQTPVFEAFTNNASSMKSKVLSISNLELLYLPVIKLNTVAPNLERVGSGFGKDTFILLADKNTQEALTAAGSYKPDSASGVLEGMADSVSRTKGAIVVDQGLDTTAIDFSTPLDFTLRETSYTLELDGRLFGLTDPGRQVSAFLDVSATDDDGIDTYIFSADDGSGLVVSNNETANAAGVGGQTIAGPRGTRLEFSLKAKMDLANSDYYFNEFGSTDAGTVTIAGASITGVRFIDTFINIYGVTTGYNLQIPIRIVKKT
jgi:hypothetical protein